MIMKFLSSLGRHKKQVVAPPDYAKLTFELKPERCPLCDSLDIRDYAFGYPKSEHIKQGLKQKRMAIGGCVLDDMFVNNNLMRCWRCCQCGSDLYALVNSDSKR